MKKSLIAFALLALCGCATAQDGRNPDFAAHRQAVEAFCSTHEQDCGELKQLHQAARQACQDRTSPDACASARQAAHAKMEALEAQGFPAPARGHGMHMDGEAPGGPPPLPPPG